MPSINRTAKGVILAAITGFNPVSMDDDLLWNRENVGGANIRPTLNYEFQKKISIIMK